MVTDNSLLKKMAAKAKGAFLLFIAMNFVCKIGADNELKLDQALLTFKNHLPRGIAALSESDGCYKCLPQTLFPILSASTGAPSNLSVVVSSHFVLTIKIFTDMNAANPICSWRALYGEQGQYVLSVKPETPENNASMVTCSLSVEKEPVNGYIPNQTGRRDDAYPCTASDLPTPRRSKYDVGACFLVGAQLCVGTEQALLIAFAVLTAVTLLYCLGSYIFKFSLTVMVFVNCGGGGYWIFEHASWNGLTVADLVMPWFVFILGTSVALAFHAMMKRGVSHAQLLRKLTWRTAVLLLIGVCFLNYGPTDGPLSWSWARIPGVLQRLGITYCILALMQTCFSIKDFDQYQFDNWWASVRDIILYWPEWIIMVILEALWLCLTFLLPVPGCPKGYLGPGGIGDDGNYPNCTGGAAGYIDKLLLGEGHMYQHPTCKEIYKTTQPFDPEGILGTINSVLMAFFGLQAGKIILIYRLEPLSILKRFLIWAILLGVISTILTKCTQNEGFIPINKNLWSLSFVTTLSCFSFVLLGLMFYVIDVKNWWGGQPFIFPGMNSILIYVGSSLLGSYFPFSWEMKFPGSHMEPLFQDLLATSLWVLIAYWLYKQKFFLKI